MLFSAIAVNLNKVGFNFQHRSAFYANGITFSFRRDIACPLLFYGADIWRTLLDRVKYRYPGRTLCLAWDRHPEYRHALLGLHRHRTAVRFCRRNFASSMGNISFFFPKARQGSALGINGGLGNLGVSVMLLVAPLVIFLPMFTFLGVHGVPQEDGSTMWLANAAWIWAPLLILATLAAFFWHERHRQLESVHCQPASGA
jgi:NNP family nitrate/nitrite transporter-like MFS transporter